MESSSLTHDPARLLEHADWVRALARSLVREASVAEDVAQETWLAALRTPPPGDRPVRAWLAAVARNAARQLGRAESRRVRREQGAARPDALPSDRELGERVELQRWVAELVLALDEPYRRVVLLRFFESLPPREIAVRMSLPLETVKSRLRRALDQLRERLGAELGPGGQRGLLALLPLVPAGKGSVALGAGVLVMGAKTIPLTLATVVLALIGVLYLMLGGGERQGLVELEGESVAELVVPDLDGERLAEPETDAASPAMPAEERVIAASETEFLHLSTVERGSGRPVAGAKVWIASSSAVSHRCPNAGRGESHDIEAVIASLSEGFVTGIDGRARVPLPRGHLMFIARQGGLFGVAYDSPEPDGTVEIELVPDRSLTIQTVDETGQPIAGIPVGVAEHDPDMPGSGRHRWWASTSGEQGQVTLFHVDHEMEKNLEDGVKWEVAPATPRADPPVVHIDPFDLPDGPVQLVVARGGRVVVHLEDDRGKPITGTWVHLQVARDDRDSLGRWVRPRRHGRLTKDGVAVFEQVATGLEFQVRVNPRGFRPVEELHPGPVAVGQETTIRLRLLEPYPTFTGTLVDTNGEPVAHRPIDMRVFFELPSEGDRDEVSDGFRTDRLGRFSSTAPVPRATDLLREVLFTTDEAYEGPTLEARIPLGGRPQGRAVDLGEVILHAPSVIASGRVVDARGEPLYWAGIWVRCMREPDDPPGPPYTWIHELQTQTDHDGRFELNGELPAGEYQIDADKEGYLRRTEIPMQHGMSDLEIVLLQEGGLKGDLILREAVSPTWLRVELLASGTDSDRYGSWGDDLVIPHPDGTFFLPGLEPGTYAVEVVVPSWRTPLLRVEDVTVEGGINGTDPRLMEIDLRNRLFRIGVVVTGPGNESVPLAYATYAPDGGEKARIAFTDGAATLLASSRSIDVELLAPGYRPLRASGVIDGTRVTLERGIPVRLKLPADLEPPEPPLTLWAEVAPRRWARLEPNPGVYAIEGDRVDLWRGSQAGDRAPFDDRGETLLHVGEPGSWSLYWWVERGDGTPPRSLVSGTGYPTELEIGEEGTPEPIEVCPDLDRLRELLEAHGD